MEKKIWSRPVAAAEQFLPNEYISACFGVACQYGVEGGEDGLPTDPWGRNHTAKADGTGCGHRKNQHVRELGEVNGVMQYEMVEADTDGYGTLQCTFTDSNYSNSSRYAYGLGDGQTIYWTTRVGWVTMRHYGTVDLDDKSRPLRS